jgi:hypothetical protein
MKHFKVLVVEGSDQFSTQHGPMLGWKLTCKDLDSGAPETIEINSKPGNAYKPGDEFYAEPTGKAYKGVGKYKRVQPPNGGGNSHAASGGARSAGGGRPQRPVMPYQDAVALLRKLRELEDIRPESQTTLFLGILRGEISNPLAVSVKFMGREFFTAGMTQDQFERSQAAIEALGLREAEAKAILIATCQVESRKDLTEEGAERFLRALEDEARRREPEPEPDFPIDEDPNNPPF